MKVDFEELKIHRKAIAGRCKRGAKIQKGDLEYNHYPGKLLAGCIEPYCMGALSDPDSAM